MFSRRSVLLRGSAMVAAPVTVATALAAPAESAAPERPADMSRKRQRTLQALAEAVASQPGTLATARRAHEVPAAVAVSYRRMHTIDRERVDEALDTVARLPGSVRFDELSIAARVAALKHALFEQAPGRRISDVARLREAIALSLAPFYPASSTRRVAAADMWIRTLAGTKPHIRPTTCEC